MKGVTKVFFGLIYNDSEKYRNMIDRIESLGPVDVESDEIHFDFTDYYRDEFGEHLLRRWVAIDYLIPENELSRLKNRAIEWEKELSVGGKRTVNCDPGGINEDRVVLVTTKNYSHRLYIGDGIFAEVTLIFRHGEFRYLEWSYPDYKSEIFRSFAMEVRQKFRKTVSS